MFEYLWYKNDCVLLHGGFDEDCEGVFPSCNC